MKFAGFILVLAASALVLPVAFGVDDPDLILEVWRRRKDAKPIETKSPNKYKDFEKRVGDLDGRLSVD